MVQNIYYSTVKILRIDNSCEFFNTQMTDLLQSLGIIHQSSCVYTPRQNGVAKRRHRHILNVARALRFQASIPLRFWGECVYAIVYVINRLPASTLKGRTPYEILHGFPASLAHLRVFGCLGYVLEVRKTDKFAPRVVPAVFLGYLMVQKGYKMYTLASRVLL